jgi:hypothetical protein
MNTLASLPKPKVVIPVGLSVKSSNQITYEHEKATAWAVALVFDIAPISSVAN